METVLSFSFLLAGCPSLAGPLRAAGAAVIVHATGGDIEKEASVASSARPAFAAVIAHPDHSVAAWAQEASSRGTPVVLLTSTDDFGTPPATIKVLKLPAPIDVLLQEVGVGPVGGVVGSAEVCRDLTVKPVPARDRTGVLQGPGQGHRAQAAAVATAVAARAEGPAHKPRVKLGEAVFCFAGKGGVGKSTMALALGQMASSLGLRAVVVDANRGQGDLRKYLRVNEARLPNVLDAVSSGDPARAVTSPEELLAARPPGYQRLSFSVVLAPTDAQAQANMRRAGPEAYREVVAAVREAFDLVVIDTQIVEAGDVDGMVDDFLVPGLRAGAWGVGVTDTSPGADNLLRRIYSFSARGVPRDRILVVINRAEPSSHLNVQTFVQLVEAYATWMGLVEADPRLTTAFERGEVPSSRAFDELLGRVLEKVTGVSPAPLELGTALDGGHRKGLFSRLMGRR